MIRSGPGRLFFTVLVALLFLFLLGPVLLVFPLSFAADSVITWPPSGFSVKWYLALLGQPDLALALRNSLVLAAIVTGLALVVALPAAVAIGRGQFAGRDALMTLISMPLLLPTIVLGLALLILFVGQGLIGSWTGLVLAHLLVTVPYALRVLVTALGTLPASVEEAASSLGAPALSVFFRITLPLMAPGLIAAAAIVFLVSFDEVVITLFIVGPKLTTLPVALFHYVESRTDPLVAAVSVLMVLFSLGLVAVLERAVGLRRAVGGKGG
ncbi:ABC transporter permease [Roseomonas sp. GC11]|uniref:ABC transporter permease n=1 Tax=Roseomonas sp. GC11 TaxID=2950546 RepID=UPI002108D95F|nr:ABC transporter permease [Roseomonas sp. GC11]MCQ4161632.1 ABC transporter permease [Roseomonas sp. GC11]